MGAFRVFWQAGRDLFDELFGLMAVNLLWLLISSPLLIAAFVLFTAGIPILAGVVALLAVLPMGPANAGLTLIAQRVSEGRAFSWRLFFDGFRAPRVLAWQVYGLWMLGLILLLVNLGFYGGMASAVGAFLTVLFLYILLIWFSLLIYLGPLTALQTDLRLRTIWRNAAVLAFGRPVFTLLTALLMSVIGALSLFVPLLVLLLTASFYAVWGFRATTGVIAASEERRRSLEEQRAAQANPGAPVNREKGRGGQIRPRD
jgi:uncharacterized membrane protein YesL